MREFNTVLLGKWCWRLLVDRGGMWYRVLAARYGEVAGRLAVGGRSGSVWWREVSKIRDGEGGVGGEWFSESIENRVGNGVDTIFWTNSWLGGVPLSVRVGGEWGGVAVMALVVGVGGITLVPLKVSVLAWRLLRNRLPTKDNLVPRHIIPHDARFCATGCGASEIANHLFLSCPVFLPSSTSRNPSLG
ncbi:cysteine-rich receptor-like protein kinase [Trifolium pratense]|uniref:Cysteine-rich receptor-like protein kinase n=1 Tax=Trifolium pratense TaxID=57577 RepID=A0A2K3P0K8_TRIPR|nr:cysteine-rich receptor-like protein kinase [Trifolium pratense]